MTYALIASALTVVGTSLVGAVIGAMWGRDWLPVGLGFGFVVGLLAAGVVWNRIEDEAHRQERAEREPEGH
jgi:hypothetical protein